jgi:starvation-inducible DNA-binding protein
MINVLLADAFALYLKTKNFHWHVSGPHFRDYHILFDDRADQILAITDLIAERVRKIGGSTLRSIGKIARLTRVLDNDDDDVMALDMISELRNDNTELVANMREAHQVCEKFSDVATASLLEAWIGEAETRAWYLFEACDSGEACTVVFADLRAQDSLSVCTVRTGAPKSPILQLRAPTDRFALVAHVHASFPAGIIHSLARWLPSVRPWDLP